MGGQMWHLGPFTLYYFGLGLSLIFLIGGLVGQTAAGREGIAPTSWWRICIGLALVSVIGGRFIYLFRAPEFLLVSPELIWRIPAGEISYAGAVALGVCYLAIVARSTRRPLMTFLDLWAIPWAASVLTATVLWGAPLPGGDYSRSPLIVLLHIIHLTGAYVLVWLTSIANRQRRAGGAFFVAVSGDCALKLFIGFLGWSLVGVFAEIPWYVHVFRVGCGVLALIFIRQFVSKGRRGRLSNGFNSRFPLTRWIGWIVAYVFLLTLMIVIVV